MSPLSNLELDVRLGQVWDEDYDRSEMDKELAEYETLCDLLCALVLSAKLRGVPIDDTKLALEHATECVDDIYAGKPGFARLE